ncbi:MAG: hypothetical protein KC583_24745, partial [Myxococcales bacterium]|nr:hypothetical protein [Myxococcales bacterium]
MSDIVSLVVLLVLLLIVAVIAAAGYAGYAYYKQAGSPQSNPNPDGSGLQSPLPKVTYDPKGGWR